ncbi:adenylate/guanylate cyclase domain-containing protein [bacterium]|nr:adenylate/guanylate cyclase domain-containing protein [bacterium]
MSNQDTDRKIAVIFATDVVGYSKHIENDEDATLASLNDCNKIIELIIKKQKGRIFNTGGDSVFAEFPSAVAAINMAVEFQKKIKERNDKDTTKVKLEYRIGINMGDVVKQGDKNLMGDGVNIAARLEALAQPGGITIAKNVYDLVAKKTKYEFNDLGEQKVKENTFHAYDLLLDPSQKRKLKTQSSKAKFIGLVGVAVAAVFIGLFFTGIFETEKKLDTSKIVVLPFKSLSDTKKEKLLALGISQDLGSKLTKSSKSLNILNLKKIPKDLSDVSKKTNASYLVDGNIMQIDNMLRVKVDLIDGKNISNIWSETYDRDLTGKNIFNLQDEIIKKIINELVGAGAVLSKDINKKIASTSTSDISIYECINFARGAVTPSLNPKAIECLEKSIKKDPNYADAWIWLADRKRAQHSSFSMTNEFKYMLEEASKEIDRGLILDPEHAFGYSTKLQIEFYKNNWQEMFNVAEKAYSLAGERPHLLGKIGYSLAYGGQCEKEDIYKSTDELKSVKNNRCQFQRGCWEIGKKAYFLDTGNYATWDNYLLAQCYQTSEERDKVIDVLEPLQHKNFVWWNLHLGLAYDHVKKFEIAKNHFEFVKKFLKENHLSKIKFALKKQNQHINTYPYIETILKKYDFE